MKKILALVLAVVMVAALFAGCKEQSTVKTGEFTYNSYSLSLGTKWNPHNWDTNGDSAIMAYIETPLVDMSIKDSKNQVYQWIYLAATSITDVTKDHKDDLTKYNVTFAEGKDANSTESGYVFEIKLNDKMKWENGDIINADTYVESMKLLLDPEMKNYRANLYYDGESAVAGGAEYYNSKSPIYNAMVPSYGEGETPDYSYDLDAGIAAGHVYINVSTTAMTLASYSLSDLVNSYGAPAAEELKAVAADANYLGYTLVTAENLETVKALVGGCLAPFGINWAETDEAAQKELLMEALWVHDGSISPAVDFETVGLYKVDDYTIRYVTQTAIELNYFLTSCTSNWIVHKPTYEAGYDTTGALKTTNYNTSKETTMSYGPYKIGSLETDKQIVFVQNENWYDWEKVNDQLVSYTDFEVDGKKVQQYQTTKVVIDVIADEAAVKQAFLKGELDDWAPEADDLVVYGSSDRMYKADETYTMSFFFNTNLDHLKEMDKSKGNTNSVVLTNESFRKAMSLAIDRADFVKATAGYTPAYSLMNNLYYYDVYNNPESQYRKSAPAMEAICKLYGVEYGEGKAYATLEEAYKSVNGLNMTEAKNLMKTACDELVAAGLYNKGDKIVINVGWAKGALTSADEAQITKLEAYFNEAMKDSGFGELDLIAVGNINDRYGDVPAGEYAIGWGAWGGAAFYPFRNFQVYCDPDQYDINEAANWNPKTEELTLNVEGKDVTMTWQEWSGALMGNGQFANSSFETKLQVTADMEYLYLNKFYRIPMCGTTICSMLSYKLNYYTEDYNIMYGWGGLRLATYNYNDAEWAEYCNSQNNELKYT
ncbi:MAG: hypothetical protein E7470_00415 [Ruminococcaceae bacterium]|nr:hypothetical protein [Oscillospiraceae bacterium]